MMGSGEFCSLTLDSLGLAEVPDDGLPVRMVHGFATLASTNSWCVEHSSRITDDRLPLLVVCDHQSAGRGRIGRSWHADKGTLTFSILDNPARLGLSGSNFASLSLAIGLSIAEAIEACCPPYSARLKWPNDVYVSGKKVAGVLIENAVGFTKNFGSQSSSGQVIQTGRIVIGIGVNVSTNFLASSPSLQSTAGSLVSLTGIRLTRLEVLREVLGRLSSNFGTILESSAKDTGHRGAAERMLAGLLPRVRSRCLLTGESIHLRQGPESLEGVCRGVASDGSLLVERGGELKKCYSGEAVRIASP